MALTPDQVKSIAHLARLGVDKDKLGEYADEMTKMLGLVEQMNAVDTSGVEPMAHPGNASNRLREDRVTESNQREVLQKPAPAVKNGLFLVVNGYREQRRSEICRGRSSRASQTSFHHRAYLGGSTWAARSPSRSGVLLSWSAALVARS